jgi:NADPH2:quinone reductase
VDEAGPGLIKLLRRLGPGKRVAVLNGKGGNWQEYVVVPAKQVVPVPDSIPDEQVATFFVNPASALAMVRHILKVKPNNWLLQTAAGSALGRMVIRLGKMQGFRTINVVRRRDQVQELFNLGASAVICTADESIDERVKELTSGEGVAYALDAVGGEMGTAALRALGAEGHMVCYGTLSAEPISFDPRHLMAGHRKVEGFWLSNWIRQQNVLTMLGLFRSINQLLAQGAFTTEIGATFKLDDIQQAVKEADQPGRKGKVLLKMG